MKYITIHFDLYYNNLVYNGRDFESYFYHNSTFFKLFLLFD